MTGKTLISGIKPTGDLHIGNYFGAIRQFVNLQHEYNMFVFIADYHALNTIKDADVMRRGIMDVALGYLAVGLDPKNVTFFKQSDIPEHAELCWIFDTITSMPYLMRGHAFKDAEAKDKDINVGTFNYPMLMAADILLYDAEVVPVGQDQKQHIEFARDTAEKFNRIFGETFTLPDALIMNDVAVVVGTDGRKMSKSYKNTIPLFADRETIHQTVMGMVTDSSGELPENVYAIHRLFKTEEELASLYAKYKGNYKALKEALIDDIDAFMAPLREKRAEYEAQPEKIKDILTAGGEHARAIAAKKMKDVRKKIGVIL